MTRRLLLIRHAEADPTPPGGTDHDRPLAPFGRAQAAAIGRQVASGALPNPQLVYRSDAVRARQTWDLAAAASGNRADVVDSRDLYSAPLWRVVDAVRETDDDITVLAVVGHAPEIPGVAKSLDAAPGVAVPGWPPATVGVVEVADAWADFPAGARLVAVREIH